MKKKINRIVLYGEDSDEVNSYPTLWDAYRGLKETKKFDKENGFEDKYYFMHEYEKDGALYQREIKIYRRGNKIFYKYV